jgi:hypothetical protein
MNLYPCFAHMLSSFGEILHERFTHNAIKHVWILWKLVQERLYFSTGHKWSYVYMCTVKRRDILSVNNAWVKSLHCVTGYTIRSLVIIPHLLVKVCSRLFHCHRQAPAYLEQQKPSFMCDIAFMDHNILKYMSTELGFGEEYVLHDCLLQGLVM